MDSILYDSKNDQMYRFGLHILEYVPKNMKQSIIDIGSGSGALTKELTNYGGYVIGVDKDIHTVAKASRKYPMVPFYVMDALRLQYENRFDIAFSNAVVQEIEDKEKLFASIYKCLKTGGKFIAEFASKNGNKEFFDELNKELEQHNLDKEACRYFLIDKDTCVDLLEKVGFKIVRIEENIRSTYVRGDDENVRELIDSTISPNVRGKVRKSITANLMQGCIERFKTPRGWVKDVCRIRVVAEK